MARELSTFNYPLSTDFSRSKLLPPVRAEGDGSKKGKEGKRGKKFFFVVFALFALFASLLPNHSQVTARP
jgi:hypothetical protein